ncbi:MAG TPA: hypothetical protein DCE23_03430, partial [Firmicutes bacterium]|nr:hypothetical protein [Bacillota bacterium]
MINSLDNNYRPSKITKKKNIYILDTNEGKIVVKPNPKIDYNKLYKYLKSRSFSYIPNKIDNERDIFLILEYQEDLSIDNHQKAADLIHLVALLHSKTSYFKTVTTDSYKEIYDNIKNNIDYAKYTYESYYNKFITKKYYNPSSYLFLRNYSLIYNAINYCYNKLDTWYQSIKDKNKERIALIHNNLSLDHLIKNNEEYLISWDNYTFDTPVLDLYTLYKNEWQNIDFKEILNIY